MMNPTDDHPMTRHLSAILLVCGGLAVQAEPVAAGPKPVAPPVAVPAVQPIPDNKPKDVIAREAKAPAIYIDRYDADGDGKLSAAELATAAQKLVDASLPVLFKEFDKNGNGVLDGAERQAALAAALKEYDLNSDGKIDFDEAVKMYHKVKAVRKVEIARDAQNHKAVKMVQRYDFDGDGKLSDEELRRAKEMKQENIKAPPLDE
jgi:Ca2+-binding EF-hand superfamily protein